MVSFDGGSASKVDDVTVLPSRHKMADMYYYGNVMTTTRWWLCVTILHLQQYSHRLNLFLWVCVCIIILVIFSAPYYIVTCSPSGCTIPFHIISQKIWFSKKKIIEWKMRVLFSLQLLSEIFFILRRIKRDIIT